MASRLGINYAELAARRGGTSELDERRHHGQDIISKAPRILYLAGFGRSGSTLLERLLGELPGVCPAGEVVHMWQRGVREDERCGCGEPFRGCPFWRQVGVAAFGGWDKFDVERVTRLRAMVDRSRFVPLLSTAASRRIFLPGLDEYTKYYLRVYAAIAEVSKSDVVIDSSKHASLAYCLRSRSDLDLRVLHVIRDSRAVAYSWSRMVRRPETIAETRMATYSASTAAMRWNVQNGALQLLSRLGTPVLRMRYEDLMRDPGARLREIAAFAGLPSQDTGPEFLHADGPDSWYADLGAAHTASGNPMRFSTGRVAIRSDDRWRAAMLASNRRMVTTMTFPLLRRYGYLGSRS
jgi:hypothetical protein